MKEPELSQYEEYFNYVQIYCSLSVWFNTLENQIQQHLSGGSQDFREGNLVFLDAVNLVFCCLILGFFSSIVSTILKLEKSLKTYLTNLGSASENNQKRLNIPDKIKSDVETEMKVVIQRISLTKFEIKLGLTQLREDIKKIGKKRGA